MPHKPHATKTWWNLDWVVPALLILVLAGIGYGFLWRQGEVLYSPHSDFMLHGLGAKTVLYKALGEECGIPFWREDQLAGYPAFTNPQMLFTYPLHFLFYFLEPANAIGGTLWLHFVTQICKSLHSAIRCPFEIPLPIVTPGFQLNPICTDTGFR